MKRIASIALAATAALFVSGCTHGYVYTHTVRPLSQNHRPTTIVQSSAKGSVKRLDIRVVPLDFEWSSNAIGDIARKHGMEEVYFADMEIFSIFSVWTQRTVHLYGK